MMKKTIAILLAMLLILTSVPFTGAFAAEDKGAPSEFAANAALYVHAVSGSADTQAWQAWQSVHDEDFEVAKPNEKYFFLPSSAAENTIDVYNGFDAAVTLNGVSIASHATESVAYTANTAYTVSAGGSNYTLKVMNSNAEGAIYINNPDADGNGTDLMTYLNASKENSAKATGAIVTPDGKIDNTVIKKIKGRGNTSWDKPKKGYNITYDKKVDIAGMEKNKKYSILPNYQDDSLSRNRILYDLSDAVGLPYASDSRYVDFYVNGYYWGSYLMCEKVEPGSLVPEVTDDGYLNEDGTIKEDFPFIAEVDASATEGDYYVTTNNMKITIKAPEVDPGQPGYEEVKNYVKEKFSAFYTATAPSGDLASVADVNSVAKLYLINELGKNWDSGVSSTFFTYRQDENGNYKFYGSPVWDYDNSLGNAKGVEWDLRNIGVTDYEQYTGWWCQHKGKDNASARRSNNIIARISQNATIKAALPRIWFEKFIPALEHFSGEQANANINLDFYSKEMYFSLIKDSAEMNYESGWLINTGSWIADHSRLNKATFDSATQKMVVDTTATRYDVRSYDDMYDYASDWMLSRAAWLSEQFAPDYVPSEPDIVPTEPETEPEPEPTLPPEDIIEPDLTGAIAAWVFDSTDKAEGDKLTEYGNSDGYAATYGSGAMTLTVSGEKGRALEWSAPEYGKSGTLTVPIMAAGSKNQWGSPYIRLTVPARGYSDLKLTAYFAASNKTPAAWKLQYSTDGESFTDIEGAQFTVSAENRKVLTAYFDRTMLPDMKYYAAQNEIILQLVPVSMITVAGGNAADSPSSGELALNYVVVSGHEVSYDDVILGDIDGSGEVDITDATVLQRWLVDIMPLSSASIKAGCVRGTETPDISDVTIIQRALVGIVNQYLNLS